MKTKITLSPESADRLSRIFEMEEEHEIFGLKLLTVHSFLGYSIFVFSFNSSIFTLHESFFHLGSLVGKLNK